LAIWKTLKKVVDDGKKHKNDPPFTVWTVRFYWARHSFGCLRRKARSMNSVWFWTKNILDAWRYIF